ncbi:hypothetical protein LWI28_020964 [Acer negundo]|uniref:Myb-like domain-containing protein n=1 Tax=Acer negundo TaxID=4023 RepID=A0AAD5IWW6_ACENE|nr:hypothetical protein LWI28_020964 [Acer negundo]
MPTVDGSGERTTKATRHPRWSRQETIVLIQGKKAVENRIRVCRNSTLALGSSEQYEPKWDSVASYCKHHGVNREPVQCRKRWSNLLVDFRKIKAWESQVKEDVESFWIMRNDLRKEMKLPGFFDKDVYDALDRDFYAMPAIPLALVKAMKNERGGEGHEIVAVAEEEEEEEEEEDTEAVFDSGRQAAAEGGLFSEQQELQQSQVKETVAKEGPIKAIAAPSHISDTVKESYLGTNEWPGSMSRERFKRRRLALHANEDNNMEDQLIKVLEKNSSMLTAQLEAQNINSQLDRDQRKEQSNSLAAAINNLTDALVKIANKL